MPVLRAAFRKPLHTAVSEFLSSAAADTALVEADIRGSLAHVAMLAATGLITARTARRLSAGLRRLARQWRAGSWRLDPECEDVHMNVERALERMLGADAASLHTARSRNDQVALDLRLRAMELIDRTREGVGDLVEALAEAGARHLSVRMPGYTHLQRAQPVLLTHVLLSFAEPLLRDMERMADCRRRTEVSPLGAGALAGSTLPIDPRLPARTLGLPAVFANSIDAVSDRDFVAELLFDLALLAIHLSQIAENLLLWATREFGFIGFPDSLSTGSSLMPQKRNPDPIELVRGKAGSVVGELVNVLLTLKALPSGYNRDLQETKPPLERAFGTVAGSMRVLRLAVSQMEVQPRRMAAAAEDPELMATDLVEQLVRAGMPFRRAHEAISELCRQARESGRPLGEMDAAGLGLDLAALLKPARSIAARESAGGTGLRQVRRSLHRVRTRARSVLRSSRRRRGAERAKTRAGNGARSASNSG